MEVTYQGRCRAGRFVPVGDDEVFCGLGDTVDLPEPIAKGLVARGDWVKSVKKKSEESS